MLRSITSEQFFEWVEYSRLEPFDATREDYRIASVVQAIVNMNRDTKKHPDPLPIEDFLLRFGDTPAPQKRQQSATEMKWLASLITEAYGD